MCLELGLADELDGDFCDFVRVILASPLSRSIL